MSFVFFIILLLLMRGKKERGRIDQKIKRHKVNLFIELHIWKKIGLLILPTLTLTIVLNIFDAFFWTVGPLVGEGLSSLGELKGFFMAAYSLPPLIVGWFIGAATQRLGKKKTAITCLLISSIIISCLAILTNTFVLLFSVFIASCFLAIAWPAVNGVYADYISESPLVEKEVEGVLDFSANIGYIIGPMLAGLCADHLGNIQTFSLLGLCGVVIALILFKVTPKEVKLAEAITRKDFF